MMVILSWFRNHKGLGTRVSQSSGDTTVLVELGSDPARAMMPDIKKSGDGNRAIQ